MPRQELCNIIVSTKDTRKLWKLELVYTSVNSQSSSSLIHGERERERVIYFCDNSTQLHTRYRNNPDINNISIIFKNGQIYKEK